MTMLNRSRKKIMAGSADGGYGVRRLYEAFVCSLMRRKSEREIHREAYWISSYVYDAIIISVSRSIICATSFSHRTGISSII